MSCRHDSRRDRNPVLPALSESDAQRGRHGVQRETFGRLRARRTWGCKCSRQHREIYRPSRLPPKPAALALGTSRYAVAQFIFSQSSEFKTDWIQGLYGFFDHRAPTADELASSLTTLRYEGEKQALAQIVASPSAYGVLSDHMTPNVCRNRSLSDRRRWDAALESQKRRRVGLADAWQKEYFQGRDALGRPSGAAHTTKIQPPRLQRKAGDA